MIIFCFQKVQSKNDPRGSRSWLVEPEVNVGLVFGATLMPAHSHYGNVSECVWECTETHRVGSSA